MKQSKRITVNTVESNIDKMIKQAECEIKDMEKSISDKKQLITELKKTKETILKQQD